MGLDSVELIVSFENHFDIAIPDGEAENIVTVQDAAHCIAQHLKVTSTDENLKQDLFEKLKRTLMQLQLCDAHFNYKEAIFARLNPNDLVAWQAIEKVFNGNLQKPIREKKGGWADAFSFVFYKPNYHWLTITVEQFILANCALNYAHFIQKEKIKSYYEILAIVIGLTSDKCGLDVYEVRPNLSFVMDMGID